MKHDIDQARRLYAASTLANKLNNICDAREGRGPKRVRIGNRAYYWRSQCEDYLRQLFEAD